jgi:PAS domain S-box-containing protein
VALKPLLARALDESALLLIADEEGTVLHASDHAASFLVMPAEEIVGRAMQSLLADEGGVIADLWPRLRTGSPWTGDIARTAGGLVRWLRVIVLPTHSDEGARRYVAIAVDVPGPVQTELALRDAIDLYENAPYGLHSLDIEGRILQVNTTWLRWTGYARKEVEGKMLFKDLLTPASLSTFLASYPTFKERGEIRDLEFTFRRKDGSTFPVLLSSYAVRDAAGQFVRTRSVIVDLSDRKRAEMAAGLLKDRLIDAVESIPDAFAIFDKDDRLVLCNSAYRLTLPPSISGPAVGLRFGDILDAASKSDGLALVDETPAAYQQRRLAYRASPQGFFETRMSDGHTLRILERRTIEGGTVSICSDITDDVRREDELREARRAADAASAAKSEFLSSMSHELRTPLNAILGFAQLLQRDKDIGPRQQGWLKHVLRGGEHLLTLIDEVLDLARVESGSVPISAEPVGVHDVLREVMTTLGPMAQSRGVSLRLAPVPPDLPQVVVDRTRFSQILLNYGSNAIKYNRAGGHAEFVASLTAEGKVRVTVLDTGIGVAPERQQELFQAFHRLGQEAGPIEGTGIGLAITKRIAELMGGTVGARSTHHEGSAFWVDFLPHVRSEAPHAPIEAPSHDEARSGESPRRCKVLYVEDNPANLMLMQELLATLERFDLMTAPTAEIGIELARAHRPDVIVLDINLPGMSGYDALEHLRRWPETTAIPVLALSASAMERDVRRALAAGFRRYLTKPVRIEALLDALEECLSACATPPTP